MSNARILGRCEVIAASSCVWTIDGLITAGEVTEKRHLAVLILHIGQCSWKVMLFAIPISCQRLVFILDRENAKNSNLGNNYSSDTVQYRRG